MNRSRAGDGIGWTTRASQLRRRPPRTPGMAKREASCHDQSVLRDEAIAQGVRVPIRGDHHVAVAVDLSLRALAGTDGESIPVQPAAAVV